MEAFPDFDEPEPDEGTPAWEKWDKRRKSHYAQKGAHRKFAVSAGRDIKQAERYTKMATQKTLASEGMDKFARAPKSNVRKLREK